MEPRFAPTPDLSPETLRTLAEFYWLDADGNDERIGGEDA